MFPTAVPLARRGRVPRAAVARDVVATLLPVATALIAPAPGSAQLCFNGRPPPRCQVFAVVEIGGYGRIAGTTRPITRDILRVDGSRIVVTEAEQDTEDALVLLGGVGINLSETWALGLGGGVDLGHEWTRSVIRGRVRRWLGTTWSADLEPGVFRQPDQEYDRGGEIARWGGELGVRVSWRDLLFVSARYTGLPTEARVETLSNGTVVTDPGGVEHALLLGGGAGNGVGLGAGLVAFLVLSALLSGIAL